MSNLSASPETISPKQAEAWIEHNYQYNRPISQAHVAFLASEMEKEQFTSALIHFVYEGENIHLINGQHTLRASIKSGKSFDAIVVRERISANNMQSLAKKYMHHDIHRKRSFMDTARAFHLGEKMGVPDSWLNRVAAAIKYGRTGFGAISTAGNRDRSTYTSVSDLFDLVQVWKKETIMSYELMGTLKRSRPIGKRAFLSVALVTMYYQPEKAHEFWKQASLNDGLSIGDPRKTLFEYAQKTMTPRGAVGLPIPSDLMSIAASYCWNAYIEDRPLTRISVRSDVRGNPITLLECGSYTGNQSLTFWPARNRELHNVEKMWQSESNHNQQPEKAA